jgi:hypothetical protein
MIILFPKADKDPILFSRRLVARKIQDDKFIGNLLRGADDGTLDPPIVKVTHGGSVGVSYGHEAYTECLVVCVPDQGVAVAWGGRTNANKVTDSSAAISCFKGTRVNARPFFDKRYKDSTKKQLAWQEIVDAANAELVKLYQEGELDEGDE